MKDQIIELDFVDGLYNCAIHLIDEKGDHQSFRRSCDNESDIKKFLYAHQIYDTISWLDLKAGSKITIQKEIKKPLEGKNGKIRSDETIEKWKESI